MWGRGWGWSDENQICNAKQTFPRAGQVKTHGVFLLALEPPGAALADDGVLPEGLTLLAHQVVVGPLGQLRDLWDVIVD